MASSRNQSELHWQSFGNCPDQSKCASRLNTSLQLAAILGGQLQSEISEVEILFCTGYSKYMCLLYMSDMDT